jgi:L-threonylcarbamoyladenylate synthase
MTYKIVPTKEAIKILKDGGIIIYPTDTAFGIGCRIDNHVGVDRLFALRRRPASQAMPVLVSSVGMALKYLTSPSDIVRRMMERYWPGGLTIVADCDKNLIYSPIRGGGGTVGLRMPNHETALGLISGVGVPILGPSANFHGEPTPYRTEDLDQALVALVDGVVEGECRLKTASTVVDVTVNPPRVIRQGAVVI